MAPSIHTPTYARLTRSVTSFGLRYSLWRSDDHLLQVGNQHFSEQYQRFYFRDIQAIVIQATPRYRITHFWLGLGLVLFAGLLVIVGLDNWQTPLLLAAPFAALATIWVINLVGGPTCVCYIQTAVQTERLYALDRQRRAQQLLATIQPLIDQAQGTLSPEEVQTRAAALPLAPPVLKSTPVAPPVPLPPPVRHCSGAVHRALALLLFGDVLWCVVDILHELSGGFWDVLSVLFSLTEILLLIAAVIYQAGTDFPVRLKRLTWGLLAYTLVTFTVGIGLGIAGTLAGEWFITDRLVDMYFNLASILFLLPGGWVLWRGISQWRKH